MSSTCHNCGLPDVGNDKGQNVTITIKPENGYQRQRKVAVWCCSKECAVQAVGVSRYGAATHRWPITLAQLRAMNPLGLAQEPKPEKRTRASKKAKDRVWGSGRTPTTKIADSAPLKSIA